MNPKSRTKEQKAADKAERAAQAAAAAVPNLSFSLTGKTYQFIKPSMRYNATHAHQVQLEYGETESVWLAQGSGLAGLTPRRIPTTAGVLSPSNNASVEKVPSTSISAPGPAPPSAKLTPQSPQHAKDQSQNISNSPLSTALKESTVSQLPDTSATASADNHEFSPAIGTSTSIGKGSTIPASSGASEQAKPTQSSHFIAPQAESKSGTTQEVPTIQMDELKSTSKNGNRKKKVRHKKIAKPVVRALPSAEELKLSNQSYGVELEAYTQKLHNQLLQDRRSKAEEKFLRLRDSNSKLVNSLFDQHPASACITVNINASKERMALASSQRVATVPQNVFHPVEPDQPDSVMDAYAALAAGTHTSLDALKCSSTTSDASPAAAPAPARPVPLTRSAAPAAKNPDTYEIDYQKPRPVATVKSVSKNSNISLRPFSSVSVTKPTLFDDPSLIPIQVEALTEDLSKFCVLKELRYKKDEWRPNVSLLQVESKR